MKLLNYRIVPGAFYILVSLGLLNACGSGASNKASGNSQPQAASSSASSLAIQSSSSSVESSSNGVTNSASASSLPADCELSQDISWVSTQPLITPASPDHVSIKDPTIVNYNNLYHVFATVYDTKRGAWSSVYLNFSDFSQAASATQVSMADKPTGDAVAPEVFFFRPHNKWYMIYQWGAKYSTNTDISNPDGWTQPKPLLLGGPGNGIDYWVICDEGYCHLFFSGDDGNLYHSQVALDNFPSFSGYEIVMTDEVGKLFEASNVYKVEGRNQYLLMVEAYGPRYFRSWTSNSLNGPWTPLADSQSKPFAGAANVSFEGEKWTDDISHGEMIRAGYDETLTISPCNMQYLYQGVAPDTGAEYSKLPYRLGLIKQKNP